MNFTEVRFHDVRTVQGELIRVFRSLKWLTGPEEDQLRCSRRTDAGVHVRVNGGIVDLDRTLWGALSPRKMIRAVDDRLDANIAFLTVTEVDLDFNPRMARHRVYRYRLEAMEFWVEPELEAFKRWLKHFVGTYDARNFARLEEGKNPVRTVLDAKPWMDGDRLMGFEIKGEAFLWNQVRRVANALFRLSVGELEEHQVVSAIQEPMTSVDFGVASPEWLVLWGVRGTTPSPRGKPRHRVHTPSHGPNRRAYPERSLAASSAARTQSHAVQRVGRNRHVARGVPPITVRW